MLRVTRLHLLIAGIGVICLFFGALNWIGNAEDERGRNALKRTRAAPSEPAGGAPPVEGTIEPALEQTRRSVAAVGEAYRPLSKQYGDLPPISRPLRAAKRFLAEGRSDRAMASARESWQALKMFRAKAGGLPQTYQVTRGDTLWRIAAVHSPARAGAGWVTIWKANKDLVSDFNRIEVGWTLTIPPKRTQYIMPFWKPQ